MYSMLQPIVFLEFKNQFNSAGTLNGVNPDDIYIGYARGTKTATLLLSGNGQLHKIDRPTLRPGESVSANALFRLVGDTSQSVSFHLSGYPGINDIVLK
jgi:hypothetical protein